MRGIDYRHLLEKEDLQKALMRDLREEDGDNVALAAQAGTDSGRGALTRWEQQRVAVFKRCSPSVVFIETRTAQDIVIGNGSGFVWDDRGHVVTNYHVIKGALELVGGKTIVALNSATEAYEATLKGYEPEKDLAVLKVAAPSDKLHPVVVGSSADLVVGQSVLAIGNPFGLDNTLTTGVVSALGREVPGIGGRPITGLVQTDAAINPGNSGGPLLDSSGRLIGVNTAIIGGLSVGIGFAIPSDTVRRVVNQIIRYGRVQSPSLGVKVAEDQLLQGLSDRLGLELEGVLVMSVTEGSPAERAGLRGTERSSRGNLNLGDIITSVDGTATRQVEDLLSVVEQRHVGEVVEVAILRGAGTARAAKLVVRVQLVERQDLRLPRPRARL